MSTFLFEDVVFGPVNSRRLGLSLGLNLVPVNRKVCTFNCIYCECGWTHARHHPSSGFPSRSLINESLRRKLAELRHAGLLPDALTYAGNGEPTLHPEFPGIIGDSLQIRDELSPASQLVVLSNASLASKPDIRNALLKVDRNILKLDTGFETTFRKLNQPPPGIRLGDIINNLRGFPENLIIQSLFIRGEHHGEIIDNTTPEEINALLRYYDELKPAEVQVYTVARDTPIQTLQKVPAGELESIAAKVEALGIKASVYG